MIIYVDQDDVLADFAGAYHDKLDACPQQRWPQAEFDFFRKLKPIKGAIEGVMELKARGHDVMFATRPSFHNPLCYTEKRLWIEDHFGLAMCEDLILIPKKGRLIGDLLIDDTPWPKFQGEQILFGSPRPDGVGIIDWEYILTLEELK